MKIGVAIVTYNRIKQLKDALSLFEKQCIQIEYILVVNNASSDGTKEFLDVWQKQQSTYSKIVIDLSENSGGSGGYYVALEHAIKLNAEWIWVSDDDAYPAPDALANVNNYLTAKPTKNISAICGTVYNNGTIDLAHRRRLKISFFSAKETNVPISDYNLDEFDLDAFSYVGVIIKKDAIKQKGSTCKDFFINQDDTEHSLRLRKIGRIVCIPHIIINHNTVQNNPGKVSWKRYYEIRNKFFLYKRNFPKRYCYYFYLSTTIKYYIKSIFRLRSKEELAMYKEALTDMRHNKLGIHEVFKPG